MEARPTAARVLELDVVRGLSIFMVMLSHLELHPEVHSFAYWPLAALRRVGWSGVDVFFVLSGFLVGGLLMREHQRTGTLAARRFWARRAFKVWPTYYVFLAAYAVAIVAFGSTAPTPTTRAALLAREIAPNVIHVQNYFGSPVVWLWSLAVEEHFYLALPATLAFVLGARSSEARDRRMGAIFAGAAIGCAALRAITYAVSAPEWQHDPTRMYFPTHLRIDSLVAGVALAYAVRYHAQAVERLRRWRFALLAASVLAWTPFYLHPEPRQGELYPFGFTIIAAAAAGLVLFAHFSSTPSTPSTKGEPLDERGPLRRALDAPMRALAWVGVRSYSMYVWHGYFAKPIAHRIVAPLGLGGTAPGLAGWAHDLIYLAIDVGLGVVMYELVERPVLAMRDGVAPAVVATEAP
jgi:peptidoglycan/LPS O-acetylase OafA/YrhL